MELKINKDSTLKPEIEQQLVKLKEVATTQNMSLEEAAEYLLQMRDEHSCAYRFDADKYIEQRFGLKPEDESNSYLQVLRTDIEKGKQFATLRLGVVMETSSLYLEEYLFNGVQEAPTELQETQDRIYERIDNNFFKKVNWGEIPRLSSTQPKHLKSHPKTKSLPEKSSH
ncbi:MAG: hypothetical protein HC815_23625 [Richelia sp. RM1_1_1]|nr:hypothetical protein [Richelia sp. RM1_1_1]